MAVITSGQETVRCAAVGASTEIADAVTGAFFDDDLSVLSNASGCIFVGDSNIGIRIEIAADLRSGQRISFIEGIVGVSFFEREGRFTLVIDELVAGKSQSFSGFTTLNIKRYASVMSLKRSSDVLSPPLESGWYFFANRL